MISKDPKTQELLKEAKKNRKYLEDLKTQMWQELMSSDEAPVWDVKDAKIEIRKTIFAIQGALQASDVDEIELFLYNAEQQLLEARRVFEYATGWNK